MKHRQLIITCTLALIAQAALAGSWTRKFTNNTNGPLTITLEAEPDDTTPVALNAAKASCTIPNYGAKASLKVTGKNLKKLTIQGTTGWKRDKSDWKPGSQKVYDDKTNELRYLNAHGDPVAIDCAFGCRFDRP